MKKRLLSVLLAMSLCLSLLPTTVWAEEDEDVPTQQAEDPIASLTIGDAEPVLFDSLEDAIDANDEDDVGNGTITLLKNAEIETVPTGKPLTIKMERHSVTVVEGGSLFVGGNLRLENGTIVGDVQVGAEVNFTLTAPADANAAITGELTAAQGTTMISGAKVGVTGAVVIDDGATVTISGSEKAVDSSIAIAYDGTLYGSADENGAAGDTVEFRDGTYYVGDGDDVARRISTKKETPAITLDEPEQVDGYVIPYGYAGMTVSIAMEVSFRDTVSEDNPVTVTYYVDGKEFLTKTWESEQEAEKFIYLDDIFAACPVGIHTACVKLTYQGTSLTSKTYTATVVKSGTRISANTWRGGNPETTFDYGETFTVSVSVEPTGMSTYSAETEPAENYVVVCENGREIS